MPKKPAGPERIPTASAEQLRAVIEEMAPERRRQLAARIRREKEARRTAWVCHVATCNGTPHKGMPVAHARGNQHLPFRQGDGKLGGIWMAGRGFGKTRTGAEGVRTRVNKGLARHISIIGRTAADVRDVMIEGESGLLNIFPRWEKPIYQPGKRRVVFDNGAIGLCFSADEPDQLRGPQSDLIWGDEVSTWRWLRRVLSNAFMGLRLGDDPRAILTGTPRPTKDFKDLLNGKLGDFHVIRGTTYDNLANLADVFQDVVIAQFEGTRTGRQELNGELLEDVPGALLTFDVFEDERFRPEKPFTEIAKVWIGVDPAVSTSTKSDHTGIVVLGVDIDRTHGYVLYSERIKAAPVEAMRRVATLYDQFHANSVIGEVNNGGDYIKTVLQQIRPDIGFLSVRASVGKLARAEPVAMLYQQGRIHHIGRPALHAALEDEWTSWVPPGTKDEEGLPIGTGDSPDVMDAAVWVISKAMLNSNVRARTKIRAVPQ